MNKGRTEKIGRAKCPDCGCLFTIHIFIDLFDEDDNYEDHYECLDCKARWGFGGSIQDKEDFLNFLHDVEL